MKYFLPIIFIALMFVACKKDSTGTNSPKKEETYFRYKVNGKAISYEGLYSNQHTNGVSAYRHPLLGQIIPSQLMIYCVEDGANWVMMYFNIDSVQSGQTYTLQQETTGAVQSAINNIPYNTMPFSVYAPAAINATITKHAGGWITGTFSGKLALNKGNGVYEEMAITEGAFSSQVFYR
jgi:hypothetical protein